MFLAPHDGGGPLVLPIFPPQVGLGAPTVEGGWWACRARAPDAHIGVGPRHCHRVKGLPMVFAHGSGACAVEYWGVGACRPPLPRFFRDAARH